VEGQGREGGGRAGAGEGEGRCWEGGGSVLGRGRVGARGKERESVLRSDDLCELAQWVANSKLDLGDIHYRYSTRVAQTTPSCGLWLTGKRGLDTARAAAGIQPMCSESAAQWLFTSYRTNSAAFRGRYNSFSCASAYEAFSGAPALGGNPNQRRWATHLYTCRTSGARIVCASNAHDQRSLRLFAARAPTLALSRALPAQPHRRTRAAARLSDHMGSPPPLPLAPSQGELPQHLRRRMLRRLSPRGQRHGAGQRVGSGPGALQALARRREGLAADGAG
jgi:hypothetical protein